MNPHFFLNFKSFINYLKKRIQQLVLLNPQLQKLTPKFKKSQIKSITPRLNASKLEKALMKIKLIHEILFVIYVNLIWNFK